MPAVWADEAYESELKTVKAEEIALLRETAAIMGWSTFQQVHDCYLHMDLCLADVMEAFRTAFFSKFGGLDPLQYVTLPSAAYDAMLKSCLTERPARLITDSDIYGTVRSSIMGGLSCAFQTYAKANSPELGPGKWNEDEDRSYLLQMDISSMYPYIMTMPMPASSGEKLSLPEGRAERLAWVKQQLAEIDFKRSDETECLLFVVDFSFSLPPARLPGLGAPLQDDGRARAALGVLAQGHAGERLDAGQGRQAGAFSWGVTAKRAWTASAWPSWCRSWVPGSSECTKRSASSARPS